MGEILHDPLTVIVTISVGGVRALVRVGLWKPREQNTLWSGHLCLFAAGLEG